MRRRTLTELANNPDLISGIYNYCDRWCERCPLTSRCLVYATEQEDYDSSKSRDLLNEEFWRKLNSIFQEARGMIIEWSENAGTDRTELTHEDDTRCKRKRQLVDNHPLTRAGKKYANAASDWFREFDYAMENSDHVEDAREVIQWYQYQIAVKTMRALSGRKEELEGDFEIAEFPKDSDGSAKVALIGIDRSIAAWRWMQLSLPDRSETIVSLILQLARLQQQLEKSFPEARNFIRPGFDG
ncbi:MAG TPA: hypothetical protein VF088_06760 [Pyrinomonadaceae bacterium]